LRSFKALAVVDGSIWVFKLEYTFWLWSYVWLSENLL